MFKTGLKSKSNCIVAAISVLTIILTSSLWSLFYFYFHGTRPAHIQLVTWEMLLDHGNILRVFSVGVVLVNALVIFLLTVLWSIKKRALDLAREMNAELHVSRERFSLAVSGADDGIWDWDLKTNHVYFSARWKSILGYQDSELENNFETWLRLLHPDDKSHALEVLQAYLDEKIPEYQVDFRMIHKDGSFRWIRARGGALRDKSGKPYRMSGSHNDVTYARQAEAELLSLNRQLESLKIAVDQFAIVVETDPHGVITYVNNKFCEISKYSREELLGKTHRVINSGIHSASMWSSFWKTIRSGQVWRGEICNRAKDGSLYWVDAAVVPFIGKSGTPEKYLALRTDITEHKQMEEEMKLARDQALSASRVKSNFLANMSHEIRTPMNGIIGMTEMLLTTDLSPEQRQYCDTARGSAEILLTLINDILDLSKIEAGKMRLEKIGFSLRDILMQGAQLMGPRAKEKGLRLNFSISENLPAVLIGDPIRISQIILNLLGNAIKFTLQGEVVVSALVETESPDGVDIFLSVKDTGIGIPLDIQGKLFQSFSQAETSTTRQFGGTGLGLAISKQLVESMGGTIGVQSTPGSGSTFWFRMRLEKGVSKSVREGGEVSPQKIQTTENGSGKFQILLAEDNLTNQHVATLFLRKLGYEIEIVSNGRQAFEAAQKKNYDLIFMDCQMPEMDGYAATFAIREKESTGRHIPIVAMTAYALEGDREKCLSAGMDDYITKPLRMDELKVVLSRWNPPLKKSA